MRCNCESRHCSHHDIDAGEACPIDAGGRFKMMYVGVVCEACALTARANDGDQYIEEHVAPWHRNPPLSIVECKAGEIKTILSTLRPEEVRELVDAAETRLVEIPQWTMDGLTSFTTRPDNVVLIRENR